MLIDELEAVGIRLNAKKPDVVFKQKMAGGVGGQSGCADTDHNYMYREVDEDGREDDPLGVAVVQE